MILYLFPFQQSDGGEDDRPNDSIFSPTYHHHKDSGLNNLSTGIYSFNTFITFFVLKVDAGTIVGFLHSFSLCNLVF